MTTLLALPFAGVGVLLQDPPSRASRSRAPERRDSQPPLSRVAPATVLRPPSPEAGPVAALARADRNDARELAPVIDDRARDRSNDLVAIAGDPNATLAARQVALASLRRVRLDATVIERIHAIATQVTLDDDTRTRAIDLLHQWAGTRPDFGSHLSGALLDAAAHAPSTESRALALEALPLASTSEAVVASVAGRLDDPSPLVRASVARALERAPLRDRAIIVEALERAFARETDGNAGASLIDAGLRVARGDAAHLLAEMEPSPVVRAHAELARRIAGYRASLAAGETDPQRIIDDQRVAEEQRLQREEMSGRPDRESAASRSDAARSTEGLQQREDGRHP